MEVSLINKKAKVIIGLISCLILFIFGVFRLIVVYPNGLFIPVIFIIVGYIGFISGIIELKKINKS